MLGNALQNYALILDRLHRGKEAKAIRRRARVALAKSRPAENAGVVSVRELSSSVMPGPVLSK